MDLFLDHLAQVDHLVHQRKQKTLHAGRLFFQRLELVVLSANLALRRAGDHEITDEQLLVTDHFAPPPIVVRAQPLPALRAGVASAW